MKIRKLLLAFIILFVGMFSVKADTRDAKYIEGVYDYYESFYSVIGAVNYYYDHSAGNFETQTASRDSIWDEAVEKFHLIDYKSEMTQLYNYYNANKTASWGTNFMEKAYDIAAKKAGNWSCDKFPDQEEAAGEGNDQKTYNRHQVCVSELNRYRYQIAGFKSFSSMFAFAKNWIANLAHDYNVLTKNDNSTFQEQYEQTIKGTIKAYSSVCDYLDDSPGVSYYLKMAIKIVGYASLVLAVILGALDFIKAITSNDDAALNKAFQAFVKRLVAVALIFLTYLIVKTVMSLVPRIPGTQASSSEVCDLLKP